MKIITRLKDQFSHSITHKKEKAVIAVTLICFAISGIALPQIKAQEGADIVETSTIQQEQDVKKADSSKSKKKKSEEKKETTEPKEDDIKEAEQEAKEETDSSTDKKEHEKKETDKKETDKKTEENNSSSPASSSGNNSGSSPATPAPQPEKVWVPPVYKTVHHDAVYNTVTVVVCNYCGAEFGSAGEFQAHKDANGG